MRRPRFEKKVYCYISKRLMLMIETQRNRERGREAGRDREKERGGASRRVRILIVGG